MASYVSIWTSQIPSPYEFWVKHRDFSLYHNKACPLKGSCQKQRASNHMGHILSLFFKRNPTEVNFNDRIWSSSKTLLKGSFMLWELGYTAWSRTNKAWSSGVGVGKLVEIKLTTLLILTTLLTGYCTISNNFKNKGRKDCRPFYFLLPSRKPRRVYFNIPSILKTYTYSYAFQWNYNFSYSFIQSVNSWS